MSVNKVWKAWRAIKKIAQIVYRGTMIVLVILALANVANSIWPSWPQKAASQLVQLLAPPPPSPTATPLPPTPSGLKLNLQAVEIFLRAWQQAGQPPFEKMVVEDEEGKVLKAEDLTSWFEKNGAGWASDFFTSLVAGDINTAAQEAEEITRLDPEAGHLLQQVLSGLQPALPSVTKRQLPPTPTATPPPPTPTPPPPPPAVASSGLAGEEQPNNIMMLVATPGNTVIAKAISTPNPSVPMIRQLYRVSNGNQIFLSRDLSGDPEGKVKACIDCTSGEITPLVVGSHTPNPTTVNCLVDPNCPGVN